MKYIKLFTAEDNKSYFTEFALSNSTKAKLVVLIRKSKPALINPKNPQVINKIEGENCKLSANPNTMVTKNEVKRPAVCAQPIYSM